MILIGIQELSKFSLNVSYTTVTLMPQCATCLNSSCMRLRDLSRQFTLALQMHTHIYTHTHIHTRKSHDQRDYPSSVHPASQQSVMA